MLTESSAAYWTLDPFVGLDPLFRHHSPLVSTKRLVLLQLILTRRYIGSSHASSRLVSAKDVDTDREPMVRHQLRTTSGWTRRLALPSVRRGWLPAISYRNAKIEHHADDREHRLSQGFLGQGLTRPSCRQTGLVNGATSPSTSGICSTVADESFSAKIVPIDEVEIMVQRSMYLPPRYLLVGASNATGIRLL